MSLQIHTLITFTYLSHPEGNVKYPVNSVGDLSTHVKLGYFRRLKFNFQAPVNTKQIVLTNRITLNFSYNIFFILYKDYCYYLK